MTPTLRKLGLALHVVLSIGWLGAVVAFLALAVGSFAREADLARAAYLGMDIVARGALLPLSIGALVSGVVQSLATRWGLFRYYWVLAKLALTVLATVGLIVHQRTAIADASRLALDATAPLFHSPELRQLGVQLVVDSSLAIAVLLTATWIAVYKPWGVVGYVTRGLRLFGAAVAALIVTFIALHLSGHSPHRHGH